MILSEYIYERKRNPNNIVERSKISGLYEKIIENTVNNIGKTKFLKTCTKKPYSGLE